MVWSQSEVAVALAGVALLVLVGLAAWRRGRLGNWYPVAVAASCVALTVDPLEVPSYSSLGAGSAVVLGAIGLVVTVRSRWEPQVHSSH